MIESDLSWISAGIPADGLPVGRVDVWRIFWPALEGSISHWQSLLTDEERERAGRFRLKSDFFRFGIGRAVLRELLGGYFDVSARDLSFGFSKEGKPSAPALKNVEFNLSHSGDFVLIAIARDARVGIDVENISRDLKCEEIAARFFSKDERDQLGRLPPESFRAGFFRVWTCKEAYLKATGEGIGAPLDQFTFLADPHRAVALLQDSRHPAAPHLWSFFDLSIAEGYAGALAVEAPMVRLRLLNYDPSLSGRRDL